MSAKTISFIVPTLGRDTLIRTLASIETHPGDEILILRQTEPIPNDVGNSLRNKGMDMATGGYLAFIDDDDVYVPGHRNVMAKAIASNTHHRPIIFRMQYHDGSIVWKKPEFLVGNFGTPTLLVPNIKSHLISWPTDPKYKGTKVGDFHFMDKLKWSRTHFIWREEIIAHVRPDSKAK